MELIQSQKSPTPKQILAAKTIVENLQKDSPEDLGVILENIGYSKSIALNPQMVTESIGFKKALRDLGLTEQFITSSLVDDIKAKPADRLGELKLGAEILGMKSDEEKPKEKGTNVYNFFFSKEIQQDVKQIEDKIKAKLVQKNVQQT